jgi:hypothetical protein
MTAQAPRRLAYNPFHVTPEAFGALSQRSHSFSPITCGFGLHPITRPPATVSSPASFVRAVFPLEFLAISDWSGRPNLGIAMSDSKCAVGVPNVDARVDNDSIG